MRLDSALTHPLHTAGQKTNRLKWRDASERKVCFRLDDFEKV